MKNTAKGWLTAAAVLMLIGGLIIVAAMSMNQWNFSAFGGKTETRTEELRGDFQNISIRCGTDDVSFVLSADGSFRAAFEEPKNLEHKVSVQGGTLTIETVHTGKWFEHISWGSGSPKITLYLPKAAYASLRIENDTGDVRIPADFSFNSIEVDAGTGHIECAASAETIRIGTSTGDITVSDLSAGSLNLSVSTGRVEVSSVSCEGAVEVKVSTGKTVLTDLSCASLTSTGSTGSITLENVTAEGTIQIERSTGDVKLDGCDAAELLIETSTGDVSGTLLSEKVFIVRSDTGRIRVPETTNGGKCKVTTDTGDVTLSVR